MLVPKMLMATTIAITIQARMCAMTIVIRMAIASRRRVQPSGWDAAGRPAKIDLKCPQCKVQAKFSKFWVRGLDLSYRSLGT